MAAIVSSSSSGVGPYTVTETDLTGSDTLSERKGRLRLRNSTGSPATVNILGDGATTEDCRGVGSIDLTGGYDITVAANTIEEIELGDISSYLIGNTINVTGGSAGVFASLVV